jgi:glycosyltransferase involved in cell wall biosynthesis
MGMTLMAGAPKPTLCVVYDAIGKQNAIAKIAMSTIQHALDAGWKVSAVAKLLDESLQDKVEWLKLYVPPRLFILKWLVARKTITHAIGQRTFDVLHVYQPQVAALADVMHLQFLTRVAYERNSFDERPGIRPAIIRAQEHGVLHAEDYYFRRWNPNTHMLFSSELMRREFTRLYGEPARQEILVNAVPPVKYPSEVERVEARKKFLGADFDNDAEATGSPKKIVVGYLGGLLERKGYRPLLDAMSREKDLFLLMGGQYSDGYVHPGMEGRMKAVGHVHDIASFYAACDVFVVPSLFDPCPLVVFEAAARGCPVIATEGVGNVHNLVEFGAGALWDPQTPIGPIVKDLAARRADCNAGALRMSDDLCEAQFGHRLLNVYEKVLREKRDLARRAS